MFIKPALLRYYSKRLNIISAFAVPIALLGVLLLQQNPFKVKELLPWGFVIYHSVAINARIGFFHGSRDTFLFTRGFSRGILLAHRLLAITIHVLVAWGAIYYAIVMGPRSWVQEHIVRNPEYPIMNGLDTYVPLAWLAGYLITTSLLQYALIRWCQPTRGRYAGYILFSAFVMTWFIVFLAGLNNSRFTDGLNSELGSRVSVTALVILAASALWGGWRLRHRMEILS